MDTIETGSFRNPPAAYRPAPLWVWNDDMQEEHIRAQLLELKSHGFGGAFVHPRPGLITEYLSEEWFARWRYALEAAKSLGLKLYIYDENSYPSGFAGGHVPSQLPDCLANAVYLRLWDADQWRAGLRQADNAFLNRPGRPIRAFAYELSGQDGAPIVTRDLTDEPPEHWERYGERFLVLELGTPETNSWLGGFAYVDMLRPEVTELFLATTYEAYYERFAADFGGAIPAILPTNPKYPQAICSNPARSSCLLRIGCRRRSASGTDTACWTRCPRCSSTLPG